MRRPEHFVLKVSSLAARISLRHIASVRNKARGITVTDSNVTTDQVSNDTPELIPIDQVCKLAGGEDQPLNPATIYRGIKAGIWPKPVRIGPNTVRWIKAEVISTIKARIADRDGKAA
jgi:predicted DNA-binding transcriptional regulator AlpA